MRTDLLRTLATNFASNSVLTGKAIREIYRLDPIGFPPAAAEVLRGGPELAGAQFLMAILVAEPDWLRSVCNPAKYTLDQSLDLVRRAHKLDSTTALKLAEMLDPVTLSTGAEARIVSRVFAILKRSLDPAMALPALRQLSKCPNAHIRSKAALLIGQMNQYPQWAKQRAAESDPRVWANAVESLWGVDTAAARGVFILAARDKHHRIAANGIVGLYRMGVGCSIPLLFELSRSTDPLARAAAAWAMGHLEDPRFLPALELLMEDSDELMREGALRSVARVREKMSRQSAAGALQVQIRDCERRGKAHLARFAVTKEERWVSGLDLRQFVVWNGEDLVEEFSCLAHEEEEPFYEIAYQGTFPVMNQVKVQVYAEVGVGEADRLELAVSL
jgi:HEAT repeat protein